MNYWEAKRKCDDKSNYNYMLCTIIGSQRFSYVNRYASFLEYEKKQFFIKNNIVYSGTGNQEKLIKEKIKMHEAIFFLKEKWDPQKGWIPTYKSTVPDNEILHHILCGNWEVC